MRTSVTILPGVKFIGWVDCKRLPRRVDLAGIAGMRIPIYTDIHRIDFFDSPQCECKSKMDNAGYEETATLKFLTGSELPRCDTLGFVVTDVNGNSFLIGSQEHPRPVVDCERRTGAPSSDSAGFSYEIKHVALKSMVPCII